MQIAGAPAADRLGRMPDPRRLPRQLGAGRRGEFPQFGSGQQPIGAYGELIAPGGLVIGKTVRELFASNRSTLSAPRLPATYPVNRSAVGPLTLFTADSEDSSLRYRVAAFAISGDRTLVVAIPLGDIDATLHRLIVVELLVAAAIITALVALGWLVIRLGLQPLERIRRIATEISQGDLSQRISPADPRTEVGRLSVSLNGMLAQIEEAFGAQQASEDRLRQFLADASHELRTPLASVRGYLELMRIGAVDDPSEQRRVTARMAAETARMGELIEDLLMLARLDEVPEVERSPVDLRTLVEHAVEDARAVAPDRTIVLLLPAGSITVLGSENRLRQVLGNLLTNAIRHTPAGTAIDVRVTDADGLVTITVRDHGPGLPPGMARHVFDRFWRQERGRSRESGGAGLGLSIVEALVHAHGGTVDADNAPGGGAIFTVALPAAPSATASAPSRCAVTHP